MLFVILYLLSQPLPPRPPPKDGSQVQVQDQGQGQKPLVMYDKNAEADQFQDLMWDPQAPEEGSKSGGLMGMKLTLPPERTSAMKPPRAITRILPPKQAGENGAKALGQTPGLGASPTLELDNIDKNRLLLDGTNIDLKDYQVYTLGNPKVHIFKKSSDFHKHC